MNNKGIIAITQIAILIIGIFAMMFLISGTGFVSASPGDVPKKAVGVGCEKDSECISGNCVGKVCAKTELKEGGGKSDLKNIVDLTGKSIEAIEVTDKAKNVLKNLKKIPSKEPEIATEGIVTDELAKINLKKIPQTLWQKITGFGKIGEYSTALTGKVTITVGNILVAAAVAAAVGLTVRLVAKWAGASTNQAQILGWTTAGTTFGVMAFTAGWGTFFAWALPIETILIFAFYDKESVEIVNYQCLPWQAVDGGDNCELCNGNEIPCSEYQCRSLGKACEIVNKGTEEEMCFNNHRGDVSPPQISPLYDSLPQEFAYNPITTNFPEDRGVKVVYKTSPTECIPPFTEFPLGISLDELGSCKYSFTRTESFEATGSYYFSHGRMRYNHSLDLSFPDKQSLDSGNLTYKEGFNELFVRCKDANGNSNTANFVFKFCIDESPDLRAPIIVESDPLDESPIAFNTSEVNLKIYLNKPSECAWSHIDQTFDQMEELNSMSCAQSVADGTSYNNQIVYPCTGTLTGLQNYDENNFYIRCKSYPGREKSQRVEMERAYTYTLYGTRPLAIEELGPTGTIKDSAGLVKVSITAKTSGGYEEGKSFCSLAEIDDDDKYNLFFSDSELKVTHSQELYLADGSYTYYVKCCDAANNCDTDYTEFTVETDSSAPIIARAYFKDNKMNLITNEEANCVYSTKDCTFPFDGGTKITSSNQLLHSLPWDTQTELFIKCEDKYGNQPISPEECSMVVRAYDNYEEEEIL